MISNQKLLRIHYREIEKGKYATSDVFAHYEVIIEKREVLLLSDHRLMYCERNDLFGGWQVKSNSYKLQQNIQQSLKSNVIIFCLDRLVVSLERNSHVASD